MDDDLRMLGALLTKPEPSDEVATRGRRRLRAATYGPARRRRFSWPMASAAVAAAATAAVVVSSVVTPEAPKNGPPAGGMAAPASPSVRPGRQILLAAAVSAQTWQVGSGTYWHVETVYTNARGTQDIETWTRRDGREYSRSGSGRVTRVHGWPEAFSVAGTVLTFEQIQRLPAEPAALQAKLTHMLAARKLPLHGRIAGPGRDPQLIESLTSLLARVPAPPKVRAAAFRAIAALPDVTRVGSAPGGETLLIRGGTGDMRMIVDSASSLVSGWTETPPGQSSVPVIPSVSIPTAEWTNEPPPK